MIPIAAPVIDEATINAVANVLRSGMLTQGAKVEEFETAFAAYIGTRYAIATTNGTSALHIALLAAGIGPGDEVITTPFSFAASANCILFCGARPVFADIDEPTLNISPNLIRNRITPKTKAILPVHLYGQPCDMKEIIKICGDSNLILIEDACQAHGAEYGGKKAGSFGIGCFSFYPTKNMTTGEGGMVTTDNEAVAQKARTLRNHGQSEKYIHQSLGYNYRLTDIAAAIGIQQLGKLDESNSRRISNAAFLTESISHIPGILPPTIAAGRKHVFHQYTVRVTNSFGLSRDEVQHKLGAKGVGTAIHYPRPIHQQPFYRQLGYNDRLPVVEKAASEVLSLPVHPRVTPADLQTIVQALGELSG
ncbi:MAG: DegT/DnrJ/EryC1/StrS family aminotransferase [Dehalococcoidales bacterium]|nr:DegT/DnrJ/EryC1/StrS family aminotransferase [Dehalococcoidales bacterium]